MEKVCTRVLQKFLLCTKYYIIRNVYPYLVYSNLFKEGFLNKGKVKSIMR